jgi:transcription termination/antitermination protein NusA
VSQLGKPEVYLEIDQVSLAIGKGGHNIKLAGRLAGYEIDVYRVTEESDETDVELDEFNDEIAQWMIDELKKVGCDTARDVLRMPTEALIRLTQLEEETIAEIRKILQAEFE